MVTKNLAEELYSNSYPGRGIVLGRSADGKHAVIACFIMGRSENSRNRVFVQDGAGIKTKAFDESKMVDPSLIIYSPVRVLEKTTVVTNGDQTDTIYDFLQQGKSFEDALRTRTFEPDGPNFTPRISGVVELETNCYKLSILKSADAEGSGCVRQTFEYPPLPGIGHFLHTYVTDGNPIPTFQGEPERVAIRGDIDAFTAELWENLNPQNKISLFVRFTDLETRAFEQRILNVHQ